MKYLRLSYSGIPVAVELDNVVSSDLNLLSIHLTQIYDSVMSFVELDSVSISPFKFIVDVFSSSISLIIVVVDVSKLFYLCL